MPHLVATALTGAALALIAPVPAGGAASASPAPSGAAPLGSLRLTLTFPGVDTSGTRGVTLTCRPTGGSHPRADQACARLIRSGGAIDRRPAPGTVCTLIYAPVIAEARGTWRGRTVRFRREYDNGCVLGSRTGAIFKF
jgi:hypothetical protein